MTVDVRELLESATLADPSTVRALDALTEEPESVAEGVREALGRVDTDDTDRLIPLLSLAAAHVPEAQPFADLLEHADSTVRLVAAKACAARGEARGVAVLVDLLEDTGRDLSTRAPVAVWAGASLALARLTGEALGPPLDADAYTRRRARGRWHDLLRSRELTWSAERGEWD